MTTPGARSPETTPTIDHLAIQQALHETVTSGAVPTPELLFTGGQWLHDIRVNEASGELFAGDGTPLPMTVEEARDLADYYRPGRWALSFSGRELVDQAAQAGDMTELPASIVAAMPPRPDVESLVPSINDSAEALAELDSAIQAGVNPERELPTYEGLAVEIMTENNAMHACGLISDGELAVAKSQLGLQVALRMQQRRNRWAPDAERAESAWRQRLAGLTARLNGAWGIKVTVALQMDEVRTVTTGDKDDKRTLQVIGQDIFHAGTFPLPDGTQVPRITIERAGTRPGLKPLSAEETAALIDTPRFTEAKGRHNHGLRRELEDLKFAADYDATARARFTANERYHRWRSRPISPRRRKAVAAVEAAEEKAVAARTRIPEVEARIAEVEAELREVLTTREDSLAQYIVNQAVTATARGRGIIKLPHEKPPDDEDLPEKSETTYSTRRAP